MGDFIQQIIATLTTFPGNLVYLMILVFSIAGAFQAALNLWRSSGFPQGRRMAIGLGILLAAHLILFFGVGLAEKAFSIPISLLPVMERSVTAFSLILIIWLWAFPEPIKAVDVAAGLLAVLTTTITVFSLIWWWGNSEIYFNQTWLNQGWEIYSIVIIILGITLLLSRRPNTWGIGLAILGILLTGHLFHLFSPVQDSDIPGAIRLAQIAAYPLLLALPHRFQIPEIVEIPESKPAPLIQERVQYGISPQIFGSVLSMSTQTTFSDVCETITETVARAMLADICLAVSPVDEKGQITIQKGFDLIRQESLAGSVIDAQDVPMLNSAMERSLPLRLPASSTSQDLSSFGAYLKMEHAGHLVASFALRDENTPLLGLILLSPYSNRSWSNQDKAYLSDITDRLASILQHNLQWKSLQNEAAETKRELRTFQDLVKEMRNENAGIKASLSEQNQQPIKEIDTDTALPADITNQYQVKIKRLQAENLRLEELVENLLMEVEEQTDSSGMEQLEAELHLALEEISHLKSKLITADQNLINQQNEITEPEEQMDSQIEMFISIAQELRQPLSSILGYTDLLIGEVVGILGPLQRKFLERVRAATERMQIMLDEMLQVITIEGDNLEINPEVINLTSIIDEVMIASSSQLRDRKIILKVDLPEQLPDLQADKDALEQIVFHLIKNAGEASPVEGEIVLRASTHQTNDQQEFVLIQVADQGPGIPSEDLPRVFSRSYHTDKPMIEGVGDSGLGLSIAKTLVEAHNGRIWVDSETGQGSTFSVLIPLLNGNHGDLQQ
jgi:signal transduction histidine kinase